MVSCVYVATSGTVVHTSSRVYNITPLIIRSHFQQSLVSD